MGDGFGAKLALVLKALTLSNGRVAADLEVDKSLVGRWVAGSVRPSAYNLGRLTTLLAERLPGLTLLDWDRPVDDLRLIVDGSANRAAPPVPDAIARWLAQPKVAEIGATTAATGARVTGFWRSTRPAPDMPGRFCHDYSIIEPAAGGVLSYRAGVFSARLSGWGIVVEDQLFCCASGLQLGSLSFVILNLARAPRVDVMDGLSIACAAVAGGVPMAVAYYIERIGDLSGDAAADIAHFETLLTRHPIAEEGDVPARLRDHLLRDIGPAAFAGGGDLFLMMRSMTSLARGGGGTVAQPSLRVVGG